MNYMEQLRSEVREYAEHLSIKLNLDDVHIEPGLKIGGHTQVVKLGDTPYYAVAAFIGTTDTEPANTSVTRMYLLQCVHTGYHWHIRQITDLFTAWIVNAYLILPKCDFCTTAARGRYEGHLLCNEHLNLTLGTSDGNL